MELRPASVTMKAGMPSWATKKPWIMPTRTPSASMRITTAGQGTPACSEIAASALTSASTEPTERSMPAVVMTKVIATATIISGAIWRKMLRRFACVRNVSVTREKTTTMTTKKTAMLATPPLS